MRDRIVGGALSLMHAKPAHALTEDELAHRVGHARCALGKRFATVVAQSPMQCLARWRLQLAADLLQCGNVRLASRNRQAAKVVPWQIVKKVHPALRQPARVRYMPGRDREQSSLGQRVLRANRSGAPLWFGA